MSLRIDLKKLKQRSRSDCWTLISAFFWLGMMRFAILVLPFRWLTRLLHLKETQGKTEPILFTDPRIDQISWAIYAASARTPWQSTCLTRGLCGLHMLGKRGIPATLFLGVAKGETGERSLQAHAWLICGDRTVLGEQELEKFTPLSAFRREQ